MGAGISTVNEYVASSGDRLTYDMSKKNSQYELNMNWELGQVLSNKRTAALIGNIGIAEKPPVIFCVEIL